MERIFSPIIIKNLKNNTTKRMTLNLSKINKKIIIRQRSSLLSSYSTRVVRNNKNQLNLTPRNFNSNDNINRDITNLLEQNLLTNTEIKRKLMSAKNETSKNVCINLNRLKKNVLFRNPSAIPKKKDEYKENNIHNILRGRAFPNKTEKMVKDLKKIFSYNLLPGKNENRYKFIRPKSYIEKDWIDSDRKENNYSNDNNYFSRSFLMPSTCTKNHNKNLIKLTKLKNQLYLLNSKEHKIYKAIIKKRLLRNLSGFKKVSKISNKIVGY